MADRHQTETERTFWLAEEEQARQAGNLARLRDCRAQVEQRERQLVRLQELPAGKVCPVSIRIGWLGDALWLFLPGEIYQVLQTTLRARFPGYPLLITTLSNDWSPGYIPRLEIWLRHIPGNHRGYRSRFPGIANRSHQPRAPLPAGSARNTPPDASIRKRIVHCQAWEFACHGICRCLAGFPSTWGFTHKSGETLKVHSSGP
ncbi:MAG: hypothetical protein R3C12_03425 [Planctomycetaceae bacterium]